MSKLKMLMGIFPLMMLMVLFSSFSSIEDSSLLRATRIAHISSGLCGDYLQADFLVYDGKNDNQVKVYLTVTLKKNRKKGTLKLKSHHLKAEYKQGEATLILNNQDFEQVVFDSSTKKLCCNLDGAVRLQTSAGTYSIPLKTTYELDYKRL